MFKKLTVLAAAAFLLAGCVLQSRAPIYTDTDSELALGKVGGTTETASIRNGQWEIDKERAVIAVEGNHYVVRNKTSLFLNFIPLKSQWYVVQAREEKGPAAYMLAEVKDRVAEVRPLLCKSLAEKHEFADDIAFIGEDCSVKNPGDAKKLFTAILKKPGDPVFRLQIVH